MSGTGTAPVDLNRLRTIQSRLYKDQRFDSTRWSRNSLVLEFDLGYFPQFVDYSYLDVTWYTNNDFEIHYIEMYDDGETWECRWDRHPNNHNDREHFHPPPKAATPGNDRRYPGDWRDMISLVLGELDNHIQAFW